MEANASEYVVRGRRGAAAARVTSSMAGRSWWPRGRRIWRRNSAWKASAIRAHAERARRQRTGSAERLPWQVANAKQVAAGEARIGEAKPSVVVEDDPDSGATRVSVFTPDRRRAVLPDLRGARGDRREHHRRADPHDARRYGARQSSRARRSRAALCGPAAAQPHGAFGGGGAQQSGAAAASEAQRPGAHGAPRSRWRRRSRSPTRRRTRTTVVEVNARDRPARLAALAAAIHDEGPPDPFGAYRDLRRAGGRRLLSHARGRQEAPERRDRGAARRLCSKRLASPRKGRGGSLAPLRRRWRRRRWRGRRRWRRSRLLDDRRRRRRRDVRRRRRPVEAKLPAQGDPERPRLAEEGAIELGRAGGDRRARLRRRAWSRCPADGAVEGDLDRALVEEVLSP